MNSTTFTSIEFYDFLNSVKYNMMPIFNDAIGQTAQVSFRNDHSTNQRIRPYHGPYESYAMTHSIILKTFFRIL